jgi:hypothetical protein
MMVPLFIVRDLQLLPSGELALGGTDEYVDKLVTLEPTHFPGRSLLLVERGGRRIETTISEMTLHIALSGQRNIYIRILNSKINIESILGAIVCVE